MNSFGMQQLKKRYLAFVVLSLFASTVLAGNLYYRYSDEQGVVVIDYKVPPELVHKGYEVISSRGDVIETVAPFNPDDVLNAEEVSALEKQRKIDLLMLRSYSTLNDLYAARDRKVVALKREVTIIKNTVRDYKALLEQERKEAANIQRSGQAISEALLTHIERLSVQLTDAQVMWQQRNEELQNMQQYYRTQAARFKELKGLDQQTEPEQ